MGKKVKKKAAQNAKKEKRIPTVSPKTVSQDLIPAIDTVINGVSLIKETKTCPHLEKGINFENFSLKMSSLESHSCNDCREGVTDRRTKKGKKNKSNGSKSDSISIWVCLECGHFSCGGVGLPTTPNSHAVRHSKQNRHPLVLQFANPNLRWCFLCNTIIPVQQKDTLSEFVKALRTPSENEDTIEVVKDEYILGGYMVRGLVNLGNTCFFNSVLQNLLAMDKLRDYFVGLEGTIGPLAISLKKLFLETSQSTGGRNVINPRSFFGCVCVKAPQFKGYQQHDSHELLRCLLDGLCTEELGIRKRSQDGVQKGCPTFVDTIFGGKISSTVSCLECGHNSVVYEPYLDLSLPLPTKRSPPKRVSSVSRLKKPKLPPKKQGKFRSKTKKAPDSKVDSISGSIDSEVTPSFLNEPSWLDYLEVTLTMESRDQDPPAIQDSENSKDELKVQESEDQSVVQDSGNSNKVSWKDGSERKVHESEVTLTTESHNQDLLAIQDSGNSNEVWKDEAQKSEANSTMESLNEDQSVIQDSENSNKVSWKDGSELKVQEFEVTLTTESQNQDSLAIQDSGNSNEAQKSEATSTVESLNEDPSVIQDSENSKEVSWKDKPEVKVQESEVTSTMESDNQDPSVIQDSGNSNGASWKDEQKVQEFEVKSTASSHSQDPSVIQDFGNSNKTPVKVQEFEVSLTMELHNQDLTVIQDSEKVTQELSDVDGFGGLFDEPDLDVNPLSNGVEVKGSKATNNSESEPDEFNDTNSPISLEKCLAYFTTPELLTKTEHAWQCEQCSKEQTTRLKNKLQNPVPNGGENVISSGSCDSSAIDHLLPNGFGQDNTESHSDDEEVVESKGVKVARDASKRILINRAPPVLTIHLKRFSQDLRGRLSKLNGHVSFKDTIDLKPYMDPSCCRDKETYKYKLVGVVEHQGTMRGGHYVAYVKGGGAIWYHASDAYIREASLEEVLRCEAYILFYEAM